MDLHQEGGGLKGHSQKRAAATRGRQLLEGGSQKRAAAKRGRQLMLIEPRQIAHYSLIFFFILFGRIVFYPIS